jgi:sec-independent protein translocase protein TatB
MFGLTFEKLFLVAIIAGLVIGPRRLPYYAHQLADAVRSLRAFVETTREKAESEMGVSLQRTDWESLNLRQYDPRRIVREVLDEATSTTPPAEPETQSTDITAPAEPALSTAPKTSTIRPGQKYMVTGSAAHPVRILIDSLPPDDPRRIAARLPTTTDEPKAA